MLAAQLGWEGDEAARSQAAEVFAHLFGHHCGIAIGLDDPVRRAVLLGRLVRLAYAFVRHGDDVMHDGTFTPDTRDDAEWARNGLMSQLIDTPGARPASSFSNSLPSHSSTICPTD